MSTSGRLRGGSAAACSSPRSTCRSPTSDVSALAATVAVMALPSSGGMPASPPVALDRRVDDRDRRPPRRVHHADEQPHRDRGCRPAWRSGHQARRWRIAGDAAAPRRRGPSPVDDIDAQLPGRQPRATVCGSGSSSSPTTGPRRPARSSGTTDCRLAGGRAGERDGRDPALGSLLAELHLPGVGHRLRPRRHPDVRRPSRAACHRSPTQRQRAPRTARRAPSPIRRAARPGSRSRRPSIAGTLTQQRDAAASNPRRPLVRDQSCTGSD